MAVRNPFFWRIVGMALPLVIYKLQGVVKYLKTRWVSGQDYSTLPKYKRLVWKCHRVLMFSSDYYKNLSRSGKRKFINRLVKTIATKVFVAREGEKITLEKKIVIVSGLIILTFGLSKYVLSRYHRIAVYPSHFYSKLLMTQVKGLTFQQGLILFSWLHVLEGFYDETDNLNLSIHEWAHAFVFDHSSDNSKWLYYKVNINANKLEKEFRKMKKERQKSNYLRNYAYTNKHEFWSVCIEHFFETPHKFADQLPELYKILCSLLNQNPMHINSDYRLNTEDETVI